MTIFTTAVLSALMALFIVNVSSSPSESLKDIERRSWSPVELPKLANYWTTFAELREGAVERCELRLGFYLRRRKFGLKLLREKTNNMVRRSVASDRTDIKNGQSAVRTAERNLEICRNETVALQPDTDPFYQDYQHALDLLERIENQVAACEIAFDLSAAAPMKRDLYEGLDLRGAEAKIARRSTPQMERVYQDVQRQIQQASTARDKCFEALEIPANSMFQLTL